jgi:hypothetical protein
MTDSTKSRKGRPTLPESERASVAYNVRLTAAQHAKVQRLGGAAWIRERIDKAREPALATIFRRKA